MMRILIPVDFSVVSEKQLELAVELAGSDTNKIRIINVLNPSPDYMGRGPKEHESKLTVENRLQALGDMEHQLKEKLEHSTITVKLLEGEHAGRILHEKDDFGAEMIIMGTHGHGALYNLLVGSITEEVLKRANIPVLLVPSKKD